MIKLIFGNVGSGKTASVVYEIKNNPHKTYYSNIDLPKKFKNVTRLKADMIIKKEEIGKTKSGLSKYELKFNKEFWADIIKQRKEINVIIDEAHIFFNPRRSMSKLNIIMTDFLAMLRRILGSSDGNGELILITQLSRRLDIIAKEMATDISYMINHFLVYCKCGFESHQTNESCLKLDQCPICNSIYLKKKSFKIEVLKFRNISHFEAWYNNNAKVYYLRYVINDIEKVFGDYDTLQLDDMFSDM